MNSDLRNELNGAVAELHGLYNEDGEERGAFSVNSVEVSAIVGTETLEQEIGEGGLREVIRCPASIRKIDLDFEPTVGMEATARDKAWRVFTVSPTLITYELTLESAKK